MAIYVLCISPSVQVPPEAVPVYTRLGCTRAVPVYTCTRIHLYPYTPVPVYTCTRIHLYPYTPVPVHTYTRVHLYPYTPVPVYACTRIHLYPYTPVPVYTCTRVHLYPYKPVPVCSWNRGAVPVYTRLFHDHISPLCISLTCISPFLYKSLCFITI
jgi:hypothetical protein